MARYCCSVCGYEYDEAAEGAPFAGLPDDWTCPVCGAEKSQFEPVGDAEEDAAAEAEVPSRLRLGRPGRAVLAHRVFGYVFLAIYVLLMVQMVPRLWTYQIELPARTVMHVSLGMAVGVVLLLKIAIVRFFRRLDPALVPALGTFLLVAGVVLIGIAVPSAFAEAAATARLFDAENRDRVKTLLADLDDVDQAGAARLASAESLRRGQRVLRRECVACHDLRTVLARPRTPESWRQTVRRMADRTTTLDPITDEEQWQVTAYLVGISPRLQQSVQKRREEQEQRAKAEDAAEAVASQEAEPPAYDPAAAKQLFEAKCSQCHKPVLVQYAPPASADDANELVARMVSEGLTATEDEIAQIVRYLIETHAKAAPKGEVE
jgi:rubredoxin/mono/diheme cytochrome c family protein